MARRLKPNSTKDLGTCVTFGLMKAESPASIATTVIVGSAGRRFAIISSAVISCTMTQSKIVGTLDIARTSWAVDNKASEWSTVLRGIARELTRRRCTDRGF